nr:hypothetical protein [Vibrio splendidus]MCC4881879.1 hypothetical protein [Vibrio splendidus]
MKKQFKSIVIAGLALTALAGCEQSPRGKLVKTSTEKMTLVKFDRPKHASADLLDKKGNRHHINFGKWCSNWKNTVRMGADYDVKVNHYQTTSENGTVTTSRQVNKAHFKKQIC